MVIRKIILFSLVVLAIFSARNALAYEIWTHAYLTDEIVNFSGNQPASEFKSYIIDGSRREDDGARSLNHFYDPVNNVGLHDIALGTWEKSSDWANDSANQNKLKYKVPAAIASVLSAIESGKISDISAESDFTWHRAIEFYANNEKEKAFFLLGHILHLIEDTSVPDHTRNDPHPGNSPYENWTARFDLQNKDTALPGRMTGKSPIQMDNLASYFDELADYSNKNFYSKDTIGLGEYKSPEPDYTGSIGKNCYAFRNDSEYGDYPILVYERCSNSLIFSNENNVYLKVAGENEVLSGYWSRLSTKAVQYGAGVIDLFFKEAEAMKNDPNFKEQSEQKSFIASIADGAQSIISAITGAVERSVNTLEGFLKKNKEPEIELPEAVGNSVEEALSVKDQIENELEFSQVENDSEINTENEDSNIVPANPQIAPLTDVKKAALKEMLARLDNMMRQAVELKGKIEAVADNNGAKEIGFMHETAVQAGQSSVQSSSVSYSGGGGSSSGGGGGNTAAAGSSFSKIIISEIQLASASSSRDEFLEIYNSNQSAVNLTGWYIQKKTANSSSFSTFAPKNLFEGKSIPALGFFLVAHPSSTFSADVFSDYGLADNNSIAIKNPNGDISDKVGWGTASDCEGACALNSSAGQSVQRKIINGVFSDADNNAADFDTQICPSPRGQTGNCGASAPTSTATSTPPAATSTEPGIAVGDHILISEIMPGESGAADEEWVELYNPTNNPVSLAGWSLKRKSSVSATTTSNLVSSITSSTNPVSPKSFFLIASQSWNGNKQPEIRYTQSSNHLAHNDDAILIYDSSGGLIDEVYYADIGFGKSFERKAGLADGSCASASSEGEFWGNGCKATSTDASEIRAIPNPQNSLSLPEPRAAPIISGATVKYSSSSVSLNFSWSESADSSGATSSISYEIRNASSSDIFAATTGTLILDKGIQEIGRDYNFTLKAVDRDGLGSATTSLAVFVPSFFDKFYLYSDPRSPGQNVTDAYYSRYPFVPGSTNTWKLVLLYANADAQKDGHLIEENGFKPGDASHFLSATRFTDSVVSEDLHLISSVTLPDGTSTSAYITAAFYDWESRMGAYAGFQLVAVDKQKYYFRESAPLSSPPFPPADLTLQFDELHSNLNLSWPRATDPDSLDSVLNYRLNYSTSTEFSTSSEWSVGMNLTSGMPVAFGNNYRVSAKAVDDFGNISSSTERSWNFPEGFVQLPFQRESGGDPIGDSGGAGQRILISNNASVSRVAMVMSNGPGAYSVTDTFIEIRADNGGGMGDLIASSSDISRSWPMSDRPIRDEFIFNFPQPVALSAGTYYWLKPVNGPGISNKNFIYGTSTDIYPDGYWSGNPSVDAYFYIR